MARRSLLLLFTIVFSSESFADSFCTFSVIYDGIYFCSLNNANIQAETDVLVIGGDHIPGYNDSNVTYLDIDVSSTVRVLNNEIFARFQNLETLAIASVELEKFSDRAFGSCSELTELIIGQNPLPTLQARVFSNCTKLEFLLILSSALSDISQEAFHGLYNLESCFELQQNW